jgi:predicted amidohydrolase YtcJ
MAMQALRSKSSVLLGSLLLSQALPGQNPAADLLLIHGHIGAIVKVGTDAQVLEFAGKAPGVRIIDLHGRTATPGLIDTHAHIADGGVEELFGIQLSAAVSVAEIVAEVR